MLRYADMLKDMGTLPHISFTATILPIQPIPVPTITSTARVMSTKQRLANEAALGGRNPLTQIHPRMEPVKNFSKNPESNISCTKCNRKSAIHPDYAKVGFSACVGEFHCFNIEAMIKRMVDYRGWKFDKLTTKSYKVTIHFVCDQGHITKLSWGHFKKGANCRACFYKSTTKPPKEKVILTRPPCNCIVPFRYGKRAPCPHYNFITHGAGIEEWSYQLNGDILPETIGPCTPDKYWFICAHDWCEMPYESSPSHRLFGNQRCPYCPGNRVCEWNSLLTNYPELCKELCPISNTVGPHEVTSATTTLMTWICNKHKINETDEPFRYKALASNRFNLGNNCPKCARGYDQKVGGHEFFLQEGRKIHGDKYRYDEEYKGIATPIKIWCNEVTKRKSQKNEPKPHGYFMKTPRQHKLGEGCPTCNALETDSKIVRHVKEILSRLGYVEGKDYKCELRFEGLRDKRSLRIDIYFFAFNLMIEVDGGFHFYLASHYYSEESFAASRRRDLMKDNYALKHKINFLRVSDDSEISEMLFVNVLKACASGRQIYASYQHYAEQSLLDRDMTGIDYYRMLCPLDKKIRRNLK